VSFPSLKSFPPPSVFSLIVNSDLTREFFLESDYTKDEYIREVGTFTKNKFSEFRVAALFE